jgi:hypothetical protein
LAHLPLIFPLALLPLVFPLVKFFHWHFYLWFYLCLISTIGIFTIGFTFGLFVPLAVLPLVFPLAYLFHWQFYLWFCLCLISSISIFPLVFPLVFFGDLPLARNAIGPQWEFDTLWTSAIFFFVSGFFYCRVWSFLGDKKCFFWGENILKLFFQKNIFVPKK